MAKNNPFATAEGKRIEITNAQAKQIRGLYKDVRHEMQNKIRILSHKTNVSSIMRDRYLKDFAKDLSADIRYLNKQMEKTITNNALKVAEAVVEDSNKLNEAMGFRGVFTNDYYIPHQAVESIVTGQLYDGKWTLSKAIWSDNQKKLNDINEIVAKGMIANKSTYDIAKDLERYVNPQARKGWEWSKVYPHTSKKIDYNAQRLARTMVSHAYQESFVRSTRDNPFIDSYRWLASGSDRMCEECAERDGKIFPKDELPLDHPNGMCTFETVIEKSYDQIASDIRNWVDGTGDPELNNQLDGFANSLGNNIKSSTSKNQDIRLKELYNNNVKGLSKAGAKDKFISKNSYVNDETYKKNLSDRSNFTDQQEQLIEKINELQEKLEKQESVPKPKSEWTADDMMKSIMGKTPMIQSSESKALEKEIDALWKEHHGLTGIVSKTNDYIEKVDKENFIKQVENWHSDKPVKTTKDTFTGFSTKMRIAQFDEDLSKGIGYISEMSPKEYLERCSYDIFGSTYESTVLGVDYKNVLKYAKEMSEGTKFDMGYLDYNSNKQEGRHRAMAAELLGIEKIPVYIRGK